MRRNQKARLGGEFSNKILETSQRLERFYDIKADELGRCSFAQSANEVTCDYYEVDRIMHDDNVKIKKYYVLRSHFDVQIFSDLSFIENNGRGDIAFGKCVVTSP